MSEYEVTDFVRNLSVESFLLISTHFPLSLPDEWLQSRKRGRSMAVFMQSFNCLSTKDREKLGADLRAIEIVGGNHHYGPMILKTLEDAGLLEVAGGRAELEDLTVPDLACRCFFNLEQKVWELLLMRATNAQRPKKEWKSYALTFETDPKPGCLAAAQSNLEVAVSKTIVSTEYRGHHCESDAYEVGDFEYVVFDLSDNPSTQKALADDGLRFELLTKRMAFQVVCRFDRKSHRLSIVHRDEIATTDDLSAAIVNAAFGSTVSECEKMTYDLTYFRDKSTINPEPTTGFSSVKITRLDFHLGGSKNSRRSYYERDADIQTAIADELPPDVRDMSTVNCVQLRFQPLDQNARPKTLDVSTTSVRGLSSEPVDFQRRVNAFLESLPGVVSQKCDLGL